MEGRKIIAVIAMAVLVAASGIVVCFNILDDNSSDPAVSGGAASAVLADDREYYHVHLYANYPGADPEYHIGSDQEKGLDMPIYDMRELNYIMQDEGWKYDGHKIVSINTKADGSGRSFELGDLVLREDVPSLVDANDTINLYLIWDVTSVSKAPQEYDEKDTPLMIGMGLSVVICLLLMVPMFIPKKK